MTSRAKKTLLILFVVAFPLLIFSLKFLGYYNKEDRGFIGFCGRLLNSTNNFNVTYYNVDKADIDIVWYSEYGSSDTLVKDGLIKENINYDYGKEKFTVFYKDTLLVSDGFFSTNNNDVHDIEIGIAKTNDTFQVNYRVDEKKWKFYLDNKRRKFKREK